MLWPHNPLAGRPDKPHHAKSKGHSAASTAKWWFIRLRLRQQTAGPQRAAAPAAISLTIAHIAFYAKWRRHWRRQPPRKYKLTRGPTPCNGRMRAERRPPLRPARLCRFVLSNCSFDRLLRLLCRSHGRIARRRAAGWLWIILYKSYRAQCKKYMHMPDRAHADLMSARS